jgi:hypothetical protein
MQGERQQRRAPRPINSWEQAALMKRLPAHLQRLVEAANKERETRDQAALLRVVNGCGQDKSRKLPRKKKNGSRHAT